MVPIVHAVDRGRRRMPYLVAGLLLGALSLTFVFFTPSVPTFVFAPIVFGPSIAMVRIGQLVILAEGIDLSNRAAMMGANYAVEHVVMGSRL